MRRIITLPEGHFEIVDTPKRGIHNCKKCWFGQTDNGTHHCPNNVRCSFEDGTARIFIKVGDLQ